MPKATHETTDPLTAALAYAEMGWPVVPGAVWREGGFIDPASGEPADEVVLRPIETADLDVVREWWSAPGLHAPTVLAVTGPTLGAVTVHESLADRAMWLVTPEEAGNALLLADEFDDHLRSVGTAAA
ncbi:hypothetical protein [Saccharothrix obliqua]|uniref:hypothetical protein n=1 Tax=Saccharothrix obliqua TaxID=2861747 RepID=UPI001C5E5A99|nr:hypothetical protein [Saccharothrix obliqua]MBW4719657.1 hypothetical protein [Saccharothrix obliqua]